MNALRRAAHAFLLKMLQLLTTKFDFCNCRRARALACILLALLGGVSFFNFVFLHQSPTVAHDAVLTRSDRDAVHWYSSTL